MKKTYMNEIRCPECGKVFKVDEASYASIVHQVRTKELEEEICRNSMTLITPIML